MALELCKLLLDIIDFLIEYLLLFIKTLQHGNLLALFVYGFGFTFAWFLSNLVFGLARNLTLWVCMELF